jgi:predicted ATPase/class 3 adenylate cyclase
VSASLPSGTLTFLFTDVEGSTRLLEDLGAERYASELGRHRDVVRSSLAEHGGVEVDTQGDAFFCAFASARDAVACAAEIQSALTDGPISVRMGVHTGEALVVDRHYVGLDVHRAARIGACGHGGQIVISPSTAGLLGADELPLRDLGAHRLKDLSAPVTLYQLGDGEFPALRTLFRTNLPVPATPFLGRDAELRDLVERASQPGLRMLTLTGPGGTGKTRLALQLAAELSGEYPDGAWWVPLAALRDGSLVASALASVLEVEEETGQPLASSIAHAIERRRLLLLLDNCEHLVEDAAALVAEIASRCPDVLVLATSREALAIAGEHVYDVQSLSSSDAVALFFARAGAAGASVGSEAVGDVTLLCERLDNLPLAVELAAARAPALPPATLLARLGSGLDVLKGPRDVEERQRTLRATIAWSYGLLDEREQRLFRQLSVFVGGAVLPAVEEVCDAELDDLVSVVAKSLVRQTHTDGGEPRYWMLETIREFAAQELEASGERDVLCDRHVGWFAMLARAAGAEEALAAGEHITGLDHDLANLRAAFSRSTIPPARTADASAISAALLVQHLQQGRYAEAEDVARRTLDLDLEPLLASLIFAVLGVVLRVVGRPREALESYRTAESLLDGMPTRDQHWWVRRIGLKLDQAHFFYMENDPTALERVAEELEPAVALHGTAAQRLDLLHVRQQHRYRMERYAFSEETEALAREIYALDLEAGAVAADFILGFSLLWRGKLEEAEAHFERGIDIATAKGAALIVTRCLVYSLLARRKRNDVEGARARLAELATLEELHGYVGLVRASSAWIAYRDGDLELAARYGGEALAEWRSEGRTGHGVFEWTARFPLLGVAVARGDLDSAEAHARAMLDSSQQPLPQELAAALEAGSQDGFARALELARASGFA